MNCWRYIRKIHKELFERVSIDLDASEEDRMKSSGRIVEVRRL